MKTKEFKQNIKTIKNAMKEATFGYDNPFDYDVCKKTLKQAMEYQKENKKLKKEIKELKTEIENLHCEIEEQDNNYDEEYDLP